MAYNNKFCLILGKITFYHPVPGKKMRGGESNKTKILAGFSH